MSQAKTITLAELHKRLKAGETIRILDVRSEKEFNERHIPNAGNCPVEKIEAGDLKDIKDEIIVAVCGSGGGRSERSAKLLSEQLKRDTYFLSGGTFGWYKEIN